MTIFSRTAAFRLINIQLILFYLLGATLEGSESNSSSTRVAVCYWGMIRTLDKCYPSHQQYFYDFLEASGIEYDIFMHTWSTDGKQFIWSKPIDKPIDYSACSLLAPDYFQLDSQDAFTSSLDYENTKDIYQDFNSTLFPLSEPWLRPRLVLNLLCALESQRRVLEMVFHTDINYDLVIFIRPDAMLKDPLPVNSMLELKGRRGIMIPNCDHHRGYNDRFAIMPLEVANYYAFRLDDLPNFRQKVGLITSEALVKHVCQKYALQVIAVPFQFDLIRP